LSILPQLAATLLFVFASSALLAYSVTKDNWQRIPMFGSAAFIAAASAAQWSPLLTATLGLPMLGIFLGAKPTLGLAIAASGNAQLIRYSVIGAVVLLVVSLALLPRWPMLWLAQLQHGRHMIPLALRFGGIIPVLALLRWRRPEARLILFMSCVPLTSAWYEMLPLFLVPVTKNEAMILASSSSLGWLLQYQLPASSEFEVNMKVGALIAATAYLPAIIMVLRRPNEGRLISGGPAEALHLRSTTETESA
jgi:hypothetical protein